jgi:multisubunit Na+/H+ antiporter MnhE subunit
LNLSKIEGRALTFFFLGLSSAIYWNIGVQIVFIEIVSVIASFVAVFKNKKLMNQEEFNAELSWIMRLFWVWLFTQLIVDLYRNAEFFESIKTLSSIITLISLLYCGKLFFLHRSENLNSFLLGYILSCIPSYIFFPTEYARTQPWKFCFGINVTLFVFWMLQKYHIRILGFVGSSLVLVAIDLYTNSRSLAM